MSVDDSRRVAAFNLYFELLGTGVNVNRAVDIVADRLGVSRKSVFLWKRRFDWDGLVCERSRVVNEELAGELELLSDGVVRDFREPFIRVLSGLVSACVRDNRVRINSVSDLVRVIDCIGRLQAELGLQDMVKGESGGRAEYDRNRHVAETDKVLRELARTYSPDKGDVDFVDHSLEDDVDDGGVESGEGGLRKTKILEV